MTHQQEHKIYKWWGGTESSFEFWFSKHGKPILRKLALLAALIVFMCWPTINKFIEQLTGI